MKSISEINMDRHYKEEIDGDVIGFPDASLSPQDAKLNRRLESFSTGEGVTTASPATRAEMTRRASFLMNPKKVDTNYTQRDTVSNPRHRGDAPWEQ